MGKNIKLVCLRACLAFVFMCSFSVKSHAFGLKTHLWIGQQLVNEIQASCRVRIEGVPTPIDPQVCASVRAHPSAFLSGVLGPDAFPDLITGQVTTHPGIVNDWQTNDWLLHMYSQARPGAELAFAAGYLVHAASDSFAHTYVNSYAGDIFALTDEVRVELRHFLLEKYIDSKLPSFAYAPGALAPPADYLRDKLLHNADASRVAKASGLSLHVSAMHDVHRNVGDLGRELDRIEADGARFIAGLVVEINEASIKVANGEVQLKILRETLGVNEARLKAEQELFDAANKVFQDAANALENNLELINTLGMQARAAKAAAEEAQKVGTEAINLAESLQNKVFDLEKQLGSLPTHITREACRSQVVDSICGIFCFLCGKICKDVVREVCNVVTEVSQAWAEVNNRLINVKRDVTSAQARAAQAALDASTHLAVEAAKLQEKASNEALTAALRTAKAAAQAVHDVHRARLDIELAATNESRRAVDTVIAELARLRKLVFDSESIKRTLTDMIARSDILSFMAKKWERDMEVAGREFILTSDKVSKGMLEGNSNFVSAYLDWWKCTGQSYVAVPVEFGQAVCAVEDLMARLDAEASKIVSQILPPPFDDLYDRYLNVRNIVQQELRNKVGDAGIQLVKLVSPNKTTGQFIELLARPALASKEMMNEAYATASDSGKPLLVFSRVSDLVDADIGVSNGQLDPEKFSALRNAVTLSKLALMGVDDVRGLAWVMGANADLIKAPAAPGRASLLFDMVRSIDGNHQWQPFGLPYHSEGGAPPRPASPGERSYGYGPNQPRPGFQLFIDETLRQQLFLRIFRGPLTPRLVSDPSDYPFKECETHPFAVAFHADGSAASRDDACVTGTGHTPQRSAGEWWRRFLNWIYINPK